MIKKLKHKFNKDVHFKDILKGSAITFVLKITGMIISYFLIYVISIKLGAEGVGFYNFFLNALISLGMIMGLGMNISTLRYVGQFNNVKEVSKIKTLYRYYMKIVSPLAIIVGLTLYFCADFLAGLANKEAEYVEGIKIIGIALPFYSLNQISIEFIRGLKKLKISELLRTVTRPLIICIGILVYFKSNLSKIDVIYLFLAAILLNFFISQWTILRKLSKLTETVRSFPIMEFFKTSLPMMVTSVSSTVFLALPIFFLDFYTSQEEVGVYSVAYRLASLVSIVLIVVNTIAAPKFSELYWAGKMKELQKIISQSTKLMFLMALVITLALVFFGKFLLGLFGEEFKAGYTVLVVLVISQLVNAATGSVGVFMNMSGRQKTIRNVFLISLLILFSLYIFLGINLNVLSASIVIAVLQVVISIIPAYILFRELKLKTYFTLF